MRILLTACVLSLVSPAWAQEPNIDAIVETHVLPGYAALADETANLEAASEADCTPSSGALRDAYNDAFDAWIRVSHLRFGPSERNDRAFALAFWPDPRGSTPKTLATLIRDQDDVVANQQDFSTVSVAARGFYALEFLLYDAQFFEGNADYGCSLIRAVTRDIAINAEAILDDWRNAYAGLMTEVGNDTYRTKREAAQQFFTALTTGLEFTVNMRLGRPLGTFDRPRPNRAEARRSGRSQRNVALSLQATRELALLISGGNETVDDDFVRALEQVAALDDPVFAGVSDPGRRFRIEALQNSVLTAYRTLLEDVGPELGITAGFNSLDGD